MIEDKKHMSYRILVIDDNQSIHGDFRKILLRSNSTDDNLSDMEIELFGLKRDTSVSRKFEINCASQGMEGLEMAVQARSEGNPYAVAFVDVRMPPGWDGIETISHLWKECPDLQVVLCTAYSDYSWQDIRRILGESDSLLILKKPFDNVEVLQLSHALTRKWELNREVMQQIENLDELVRRRTEEKDQARMLLEAALEHSPAGIIISNEDGTKLLWSNRAAREIYGGRLSAPVVYEIKDSNDSPKYFRADNIPYERKELPFMRAILDEETIYNEEVLLKNTQGEDRWVSYNTSPIRDEDGKKVASISIFNNISDRKNAEEEHEKIQAKLAQIQKMESVGLLAGGVAHDYNNAMSVIMGNAEMGMLATDASEPIYETLKEIKKAAQRSADLTQQLLAFARKQTVKPKVVDLNKKISDMMKILHRLIGENIDLSWQPEPDLWHVKIDPTQIDQILFNLCANSRDAIDGVGNVTIKTRNVTFTKNEIISRPELKVREYTVLTVTDNGPGMEEYVRKHIFDPFFTTKELGKGTGLGLATVYGIVKQNDGFINVESEPGKGSAFMIYLPRFEGYTTEPVVEKPFSEKKGKGEKILMVEDSEDVLVIGMAMLEKLGYSVISAHTPEEALHLAEENKGSIDLLMTDVIMPKMNGRELAAELQALNPDLKCLFMSGYTADIIAEQGVLDEGVHFLQKPFTFTSLASKVRSALYEE